MITDMKNAKIFSPLQLGRTTLKNRIAMAPMSMHYEATNGTVPKQLADIFVRRAEGGAGYVVIDAVTVDHKYWYIGKTTALDKDSLVPQFAAFAKRVSDAGSTLIPQIIHPGPESICALKGITPLGPSVNTNANGAVSRPITIDEIHKVVKQYGQAARRAEEAGCGIALHCAHAYMLPGAFLSPLRNKRMDEYGGCIDNRARLILEIIEECRRNISPDFPIVLRVSGSEREPGGNSLDEMLYLAPKFEAAGVDMLEVSGGVQYEGLQNILPSHSQKIGMNVYEASEIKKVVNIPVFVVGKINDVRYAADLVERPPVVVVMGHVDHGKTSILDAIRKTNVTKGEAGGITQAIGAYQVKSNDSVITFLDTPGHEAFTSMRARGANMTDIAVLVVAADDGIMPQTVESINHAKAANVKLIVAINKMDKPTANPERVKEQLTKYEIVPEDWGGDVACIPVSAVTGMGISDLLERIVLEAEVMELKANPSRRGKGAVVEARLDKGQGPIATLLVQNGTLHKGDCLIAGTAVGRVRTMRNDKGQEITEAGPSTPVEITGLTEVPEAGELFEAVEDERLARELADKRTAEAKEKQFAAYTKVTLDNLFDQMAANDMKELPIIVKADVQGSAEAVKQSLEKISNDEVRVRVIHAGVGAISKSDVSLADASNAIIIGFNVRPDAVAKAEAEQTGVEMRMYRVIYDAINDVSDAMKGMLAPKVREVALGEAQVRQVYKISSVGTVAGCRVTDGKITRDAQLRLVRDGIVICEDSIASLKRFKDDAKEVAAGFECGITLAKFQDIKEGDVFECFKMEEYRD